MHERYASIPPALICGCCGHPLDNEQILRAAERLHARMLEVQRRESGYYRRRPAPGHKPDGWIARQYVPTYGRWSEEQAQAAVELAAQIGVRAAARQTGIPKSTLSDWIRIRAKSDGGHGQNDPHGPGEIRPE